MESSLALFSPGELNSRLNSDTKLMSSWLPLNANVLSRSLAKVVILYSFMFSLSPRLTLLSLLEAPLTIAAEKVYSVRHQVYVAVREPLGRSQALLEVFSALREAVLTAFKLSVTLGTLCKHVCVCVCACAVRPHLRDTEGRREGGHIFFLGKRVIFLRFSKESVYTFPTKN